MKYSEFDFSFKITLFLDFDLSQLTSLQFIMYHVAGFYKPTVLKVHPPFCRIPAYATMPG